MQDLPIDGQAVSDSRRLLAVSQAQQRPCLRGQRVRSTAHLTEGLTQDDTDYVVRGIAHGQHHVCEGRAAPGSAERVSAARASAVRAENTASAVRKATAPTARGGAAGAEVGEEGERDPRGTRRCDEYEDDGCRHAVLVCRDLGQHVLAVEQCAEHRCAEETRHDACDQQAPAVAAAR
jgi:hypothetical protein